MQYRTISLDETIYFWLRSDADILSNLLRGKMKLLWEFAERANANSKGMPKINCFINTDSSILHIISSCYC